MYRQDTPIHLFFLGSLAINQRHLCSCCYHYSKIRATIFHEVACYHISRNCLFLEGLDFAVEVESHDKKRGKLGCLTTPGA